MQLALILLLALNTLLAAAIDVNGQNKDNPPSAQDVAVAEKAFDAANALMDKRVYLEALAKYKEALAILPNDPSLLFNGGLAAYQGKEYALAADLWRRLKTADPLDWHVRAKLIQAYQALGKLPERDAERAELFQLRSVGKNDELSKQFEYCRDQFEVKGLKVMAFEHFELKGDRALRYVFSVLNEVGNGEEFRISLGSYELTNSLWRRTAKPKPKEGERLFHLDGYYKWGHATYGMFAPEPSYDETRSRVIRILEGKDKAVSSSTINPSAAKPAEKTKP
jgi:tetratricopeptide (TPR) repeat protein